MATFGGGCKPGGELDEDMLPLLQFRFNIFGMSDLRNMLVLFGAGSRKKDLNKPSSTSWIQRF